MNAERTNAIIKKVTIILLVIATLVFFYGCISAKQAGEERAARKAAKKIELVVTEKQNSSVSSYSISCDFVCTIKNESKVEINGIVGTFKIMDQNDNVLSSGEASFNGDFKPESEEDFKLNWRMDITEKHKQVYEADFSELKFSFEIEEVTYNDFETVEIKK